MTATRRLAAILVADVVGYSRLMEADEAGTLAALKERRKTILDPAMREHHGRIVKLMGDGVLAEFASAVNAVACAVELQKQFSAANEGTADDRRIVLRIGINLGDVVVEGGDLYGDGVIIATRLETMAEPGAICISGSVHEQVAGKFAATFDDLGPCEVKNSSKPVRVYRVSPAYIAPARPSLALPDKPSIAVLPFTNMSGDPAQEYFVDGMVEDITIGLSRFNALFVIARNSSFTYKGRAIDVRQVGRELGVRYVLEGSVRKADNRVRITGQLINATTGSYLWADRIDGNLEDIFDLQDQVTARVVGAIAPKLEQAEIERARHKPTENLDAYDYYLRGLAGVHRWTREDNASALKNFTRAIELDPEFAAAYGNAANCYAQRIGGSWIIDRAREANEAAYLARRAVELGKDDAVALGTAGMCIAVVAGDLEDGDAVIDRALVLNPNLAWAWLFSGWVKVFRGEPEVAIERVARAMHLSPRDSAMFSMQAVTALGYFFTGHTDKALLWAEAALRDQPNFAIVACVVSASTALFGRLPEADTALRQLLSIEPSLRLSNLSDRFRFRRAEDLARLSDGLRIAGLPE